MARPANPVAAPGREWTEEDLTDLPGGYRYEILDGALHTYPPPAPRLCRLADSICETVTKAAPPGWTVRCDTGVRTPGASLVPAVVVLRPGSLTDVAYSDPPDVALVVEIESTATYRVDRLLKPVLYAEADIESFWRIESGHTGPVAHLYTHVKAGHYLEHRAVHPGDHAVLTYPFEVLLSPAAWQF